MDQRPGTPAPARFPCVHRVLSIPELLESIFSFLDQRSNAKNACVCRQWSEIALGCIWREVYELPRLFSLLAPLESTPTGLTFSRCPEAADWRRFEKYSRRVRALYYYTEDYLNPSVFDDVGRTRTTLKVLPNLHTLEWVPCGFSKISKSVIFMHDGVKRFVVQIPTYPMDTSLQSYFQDVVGRMPLIIHLDMRIHAAMHFYEYEVRGLIRGLTHLHELVLPIYHLTSGVVEELSRLPNVTVVQFEYGADQGTGDPKDVRVFSPQLAESAFPSLLDLNLSANVQDVTRFMAAPFAPHNITSLYIDSPSLETPEDIHEFLTLTARNCRSLKSLYLALLNGTGPSISASQENEITLDTIQPLLDCPCLVTFELTHEWPLNLTLDNIEELANGWPSLESLLLNCEPPTLLPSTLTLRALLPFTRCHNLRHLGLFLNATAADLPSRDEVKQFRRLNKLSVGDSAISEEGPIALFLSNLLPLGCELEFGVTWHDALVAPQDSDMWTEVSRRCVKWEKVAVLLPLLTKLRAEEKAVARELKAEVDDLRVRTRLMMDREKTQAQQTCIVT